MKKFLLLLIVITLSVSGKLYSQTLPDQLIKTAGQYGEKYLEPFTTAFGSNLNSGFIGGLKLDSKLGPLPVGVNIYAGLKFSGLILNSDDQYFDLTYQDRYKYNGQDVNATFVVKNAPTVFGSTTPANADIYVNGAKVNTQQLIGGVTNTKFVPLFVPQLGIGSIYGTDVVVRYFPTLSLGNYGRIGFTGFAIRHNFSSYIAKMPFDIALQGGYQNFNVEKEDGSRIINANATFLNLQFNKNIAMFSIYGAAQYENFSIDVSYIYTNPYTGEIPVNFEQKETGNFRGILGASFHLFPVVVNADLNFGKRFIFTAGIGAGF